MSRRIILIDSALSINVTWNATDNAFRSAITKDEINIKCLYKNVHAINEAIKTAYF